MQKRECRTLASELRTETKDGKLYLSGYAATYNTLSSDLGWGLFERILPGAFKRAVTEAQDVRHLVNHDPSLVLGRTKAGTTELTEDSKGLKFRTLLPDASYAQDLYASVARGDIDECSFGFMAVRTSWIEEKLPGKDEVQTIRQLEDLDLFDISTVTYPAYPGTMTQAGRSRMFPDGVPLEIRVRQRKTSDDAACACACPSCVDGECEDCTDERCSDERCIGCAQQDKAELKMWALAKVRAIEAGLN